MFRPGSSLSRTLLGLGVVVAGCSFPEHDFVSVDEFEKLKDGGQQGGGGAGAGGTGGFGATGGAGGTTGGTGGAQGGSGGTGGATGGTGGATGGTGGASGGTGGATGGTGGAQGGSGGSGGASGGTGGASGGTGGASGGSGGASGGSGGATGGTGGSTGGSGGATGGSGGATGGTGGTSGCAAVVINEVSPDGATGADEYVELHNKGTCTANLSGWTLKYASSGSASGSTIFTFAATDSIPIGGYFVIAGAGYTGTKNGAWGSGAGLAATAGGVAIFEGTTSRDSMAYGTVPATHPYIEGTAAATIPKSQSAARVPNGTDTNVNSTDFKIGARSAGAANP